MRYFTLTFFSTIIFLAGFAQDLTKDQQKAVTTFIEQVENQKKTALSRQIRFPFIRQYPIPPLKNSREFMERYVELFDDSLTRIIANSSYSKDWSAVGSRGIMLHNGLVWLDENGTLIAVNYQSKYEKHKIEELILLDKKNLHISLRNFEKPVHILETAKYRVRIDDMGNGQYRYASWPLKSRMTDKPDVIITKGKYKPEGSGGNHRYEFRNLNFIYDCAIIVTGEKNSPPALLKIYKGKKVILTQQAIIVTK